MTGFLQQRGVSSRISFWAQVKPRAPLAQERRSPTERACSFAWRMRPGTSFTCTGQGLRGLHPPGCGSRTWHQNGTLVNGCNFEPHPPRYLETASLFEGIGCHGFAKVRTAFVLFPSAQTHRFPQAKGLSCRRCTSEASLLKSVACCQIRDSGMGSSILLSSTRTHTHKRYPRDKTRQDKTDPQTPAPSFGDVKRV